MLNMDTKVDMKVSSYKNPLCSLNSFNQGESIRESMSTNNQYYNGIGIDQFLQILIAKRGG